jgi:phage terminase small subunit
MTPKQQRFADEYLIDMNATQAAIRAGYSENSAYAQGQRLLKKAEVAKYVGNRAQEHAKEAEITTQDVLNGLYNEATLTGTGSSHSARVSAWGQLGKFLGLAERHEHTGEGGGPIGYIVVPSKDG